jgi:hypothetical protein
MNLDTLNGLTFLELGITLVITGVGDNGVLSIIMILDTAN